MAASLKDKAEEGQGPISACKKPATRLTKGYTDKERNEAVRLAIRRLVEIGLKPKK